MKPVASRISFVALTLSLISCSAISPVIPSATENEAEMGPASYRGLSIQEASLKVSVEPVAALLLGDTTTIDGEVWLGQGGLALALRNGRPTLYDGGHSDSFTAYALIDPIDDWINHLGEPDTSQPAPGAITLRILRSADQRVKDLQETRTLIRIERSLGEFCRGVVTGPCWIITESVGYGAEHRDSARQARTYVDAITHKVMMVIAPLADGYSSLTWQRVR